MIGSREKEDIYVVKKRSCYPCLGCYARNRVPGLWTDHTVRLAALRVSLLPLDYCKAGILSEYTIFVAAEISG